ncbi:MAG: DUF3828 domain-containing protein [Reyranella sp.]
MTRQPTGIRRRTVIFACAGAVVAPSQVGAQQPSAQAFLEAIYKPYLNRNYAGQNYDEPGRFFAPDLARAMKADATAAARRREVPLLNGDPFVDAQDWEITKLAIAVVPNGTTAATATVTFANQGKATRLLIELEQTPAGWRIADIKAPSGSLRALYKLRPR